MSVRLREESLTWQTVGDDVIVLDLENSRYLQVNGSGRLLWEALATATTESDLADLLMSSFDIDRSRANADVAAFLADLRSRGLIVE